MTLTRALVRAAGGARGLSQRLPLAGGRPGSLLGSGLSQAASAVDGMAAYNEIGAAYGPIRRICESVSMTKWSVYEQTTQAGSVERVLIDDAVAPARHPSTAILTHPNPFMTWRVFCYLQQLWQETCGGVYWLICNPGPQPSYARPGVTADLELWPIRADRITPIPDPDAYVAGYVYTRGIEKIPVEAASIIPVGWPDPLNEFGFAGPMRSLGTDLEAERYASQYNRNTFLNNAEPGGVIEFDVPLSPDRFEELVLRWREQHQGLSNVRRVAIIEGGKWIDNAHTNADMDFLNLRKLTREEVMFSLGMPFAMMQTENVNLANAQTGEKIFYRYPIRSRLENIKEPINERILPLLGENLTADYDLPAPEDEAFDTFTAVSGWIAGILKQNEARQAMGYDADDNGDQYSWQITGTPPPMPPAQMPRKPSTLSYRKSADYPLQSNEAAMVDAWTRRLEAVGQQYQQLLAQRNGR